MLPQSFDETVGVALYINVPSPFGLGRPGRDWCRAIAEFDPDLRIFPSQKHPVYRMMRVARESGPMDFRRFRKVMEHLHPDTQIAIQHGLQAVFTLPREIIHAHPAKVIEQLKRRDMWAYRDGNAVADALDRKEAAEAQVIDQAQRANTKDRRKAMRISYLYRTGARVSLVSPRRRSAAPASPPTTGAPEGAAASATE